MYEKFLRIRTHPSREPGRLLLGGHGLFRGLARSCQYGNLCSMPTCTEQKGEAIMILDLGSSGLLYYFLPSFPIIVSSLYYSHGQMLLHIPLFNAVAAVGNFLLAVRSRHAVHPTACVIRVFVAYNTYMVADTRRMCAQCKSPLYFNFHHMATF